MIERVNVFVQADEDEEEGLDEDDGSDDEESGQESTRNACKSRIRYAVLARGGHSEKFVWSMLTCTITVGS